MDYQSPGTLGGGAAYVPSPLLQYVASSDLGPSTLARVQGVDPDIPETATIVVAARTVSPLQGVSIVIQGQPAMAATEYFGVLDLIAVRWQPHGWLRLVGGLCSVGVLQERGLIVSGAHAVEGVPEVSDPGAAKFIAAMQADEEAMERRLERLRALERESWEFGEEVSNPPGSDKCTKQQRN